MSDSDYLPDYLPDYPLHSDLVKRLKSALDTRDEDQVVDLISSEVKHVDAIIELSNDDWMKDPSAQLPTGVLLGDLDHLTPLMDQFFRDANVVFEIHTDEVVWQVKSAATFGLSGQTCKMDRELENIRNAGAFLSLRKVPNPNKRQEAARAALPSAASKRLMKRSRSKAVTSLGLFQSRLEMWPGADGLAPLHLCRTAASLGCAQALLDHGASVHLAGGAGQDTPLHVAARCGLEEHARLYLGSGARPAAPQRAVQALLNHGSPSVWPDAFPKTKAGSRRQADMSTCRSGARCPASTHQGGVTAQEASDSAGPLCLAGRWLRPQVRDAGARRQNVAPSYAVFTIATHWSLCLGEAVVSLHLKGFPFFSLALCFTIQESFASDRPLLDDTSKVLKTCASIPTVIEVLVNSYPQLRVSESWRWLIPGDVLQMHQPFYRSLFALASTPRCLQHLSRCTIRKLLGKKCSHLVPRLPLPKPLQDYLLLEPEGVLR
ncbi:ankyrin repeat and SOCS box protein 18 [Orycteropus afer afer]|uniref:Ankyrin repeat and SOCS box protein 18 n=1 Tax=Orycteropus afer afer TaxID=1230840 RepID=A0A8B7A6R3_ORYAF|nr:ankyrin repeat and SOCS box protein 18 [Orycteropus afer afer]